MLSKHGLVNPMSIEKKKKKNDMTRLLVISLGNIFAYTLEKKMCDREFIGRSKDQKA